MLVDEDKKKNGYKSKVDYLREEHLFSKICPRMRVKHAAKIFGPQTVDFLKEKDLVFFSTRLASGLPRAME